LLLVSIPIAGLHPVYVATAVAGLVVLGAAGALVYTFTRGEERSVRFVRGLGLRLPRVGADAWSTSCARPASPSATS
jgi:hypothetical protein